MDFENVVAGRQADIDTNAAKASAREGALAETQKSNVQARETELAPMENKLSTALGEQAAITPPTPTPMPEHQVKPVVDAKEYQQLSWGLIGMALIGGAVSRGNWLGVSSTLNGALKGYMEGSQANADKDFKDYKTKFAEAKAHEDQAQKEFENILENKKLSINSMLSQMKIAAAKYDRQDIRAAAEQKSIDALWKQVDASRNSLAQTEERHDRVQMQIDGAMARAKLQKSGAMDKLDENGKWLVEQTVAGGDTTWINLVQKRFGSELGATVLNDVAKQLKATGEDPRALTEAKIAMLANRSAITQLTNKKNGVERLTYPVNELSERIGVLIKKVNGDAALSVNHLFNKISEQLGSKDLSELQGLMGSVGRQYIEAITMPGSNAQLHATTQDWADGKFNPDKNMASWSGLEKAMKEEINASHNGMVKQLEQAKHEAGAQGVDIPRPGEETPKSKVPNKNVKGWALHKDANGNQAYVGPGGEIEEVQ